MTARTVDVCVVGSFMADLVVRAPRRPAPGETVLGTSIERHLGGKGFNQALAASRAGAVTAVVGRLGADAEAEQFRAALADEGIDSRWVAVDDAIGTGIGLPLVEDSGENSIVVVPRANLRVSAADIQAASGLISASRAVLLQLELPAPVVVETAHLARAAGAIVVLNPAPPVAELDAFIGAVNCLVCNETEAELLSGMSCAGEDLAGVTGRLRELCGAEKVVLTLGGRGVYVSDAGRDTYIRPHSVSCVDSVGAGDAFCGVLTARLAAGDGLRDAARYGNAAGALAVTRSGAGPSLPSLNEILGLMAVGESVP
jgi:ribokinase